MRCAWTLICFSTSCVDRDWTVSYIFHVREVVRPNIVCFCFVALCCSVPCALIHADPCHATPCYLAASIKSNDPFFVCLFVLSLRLQCPTARNSPRSALMSVLLCASLRCVRGLSRYVLSCSVTSSCPLFSVLFQYKNKLTGWRTHLWMWAVILVAFPLPTPSPAALTEA